MKKELAGLRVLGASAALAAGWPGTRTLRRWLRVLVHCVPGSHDIGDKMKALNDALEKFQAEMVKQGQWDDTVIVCTSDFVRVFACSRLF